MRLIAIAMAVYCLWLCGAAGQRARGYSGSLDSMRVADEQYLRMVFLDSCDPQHSAEHHDLPLKEIMTTRHANLAQHVVGLAFVRLTSLYSSRLDNLTAEERVVPLVIGKLVQLVHFGNRCCRARFRVS